MSHPGELLSAQKVPPMVQSGTVYYLPFLRMNSPQQAGTLPCNTAGGTVNSASFRGYYHLSDHQPAGSDSCLSGPALQRAYSPLCTLSMVAPCCVHLLCALNIQYQVLSCSKVPAIWNLPSAGALRSHCSGEIWESWLVACFTH